MATGALQTVARIATSGTESGLALIHPGRIDLETVKALEIFQTHFRPRGASDSKHLAVELLYA